MTYVYTDAQGIEHTRTITPRVSMVKAYNSATVSAAHNAARDILARRNVVGYSRVELLGRTSFGKIVNSSAMIEKGLKPLTCFDY